ncbi:GDP-L-fucose synthase [sulfur-oxidizing endosymbiont of Gigantopelta aegis]|uniref:GDP-L-fucose synthase n=1 Tax=sulfur-oxidizing endosymbiont of Gigantopelta aegis TaxID=2794934 RepID=UPI0018DC84C2|nr:GDP-L-fucose synthase [sulfur-oxidizing endosymbiont of Gigantopelta aegis]
MNNVLNKDSNIYIAGHRGMVGSAIIRQLHALGIENIVGRTHAELDLCNQQAVRDFMQTEKPDYIVLAAAKVGGIHANNTYPAEFIYDNLMVEANVIHEAYSARIKHLLFLGSSCIYPKFAKQPMSESDLLTGLLEATNEPYAVAKIAGIKLCESYNRQYGTDYRSVMPTNLYGAGDNYHGMNSHVVPAMIKRFHEAKQAKADAVEVWGTGKVMREFLNVDDMAAASVFIMQMDASVYQANTEPMLSHINVGTGEDVTIAELAQTVKDVVGFEGQLVFDASKPEGTPRKLLDVSRLNQMGWQAKIDLKTGLADAYQDFLSR